LLFAAVTTAYILVAIILEERDLIALFGDEYRRYRTQVRMLFPLGKRRSAGRSAIAVAIGLTTLALASVASGQAQAITKRAYNYTTPKRGYFMVPAVALVPRDNNAVFTRSGVSILNSDSQLLCFDAPVRLPHGAEITAMRAWYARPTEDAAVFIVGQRVRYPQFIALNSIANTGSDQAPVSSGHSVVVYNVPAELGVVRNNIYAYALTVCLANTGAFSAARFDYRYRNAGD
jgi:hypothetical protein